MAREGWHKPKATKGRRAAKVGHYFIQRRLLRLFNPFAWWEGKSLCGAWAISARVKLGMASELDGSVGLCKVCQRKERALYRKSPEGKKQAEFMAGSEKEVGDGRD